MTKIEGKDEKLIEWSESIGSIIADAMLDAGIIKDEDFELASEVAAVELFVRMLVGDYPPPYNYKLLPEKTISMQDQHSDKI